MKQIALNFHGIGEPHEWAEDAERSYWLSLERFDSLLHEVVERQDRARFALTFDDGNKSDLLAADRLARMGLKAKFFILVGRIGQEGYLNREDIAVLVQRGMTIGLHGRNHLDWCNADDRALADETIVARQELSALVGGPIGDVAIPFGAYNRRVMKWLATRRFDRIHTSDGPFMNDPRALIWDRVSLRNDMTPVEIGAILSGAQSIRQCMSMRISQLIRRRVL